MVVRKFYLQFVFEIILATLIFAAPFRDSNYSISKRSEEVNPFRHPRSVNVRQLEKDARYWLKQAEYTLKKKLDIKIIEGTAKNIILFLGDGMSVPSLTGTRIYLGQQKQNTGEETVLSFEKFPYVGLTKTYCVNGQVADSACTSTAYLSGVKANMKTIGLSGSIGVNDCEGMMNPAEHTSSIATWAQISGKATGFVTTSRVTHASPAGVYAHTTHRDWEADSDISEAGFDPGKCMDIAKQLVTQSPGKNLKVILGGGRDRFIPNTETDPEYPDKKGKRSDGKNYIKEWLEEKKKDGSKVKYVWNRNDMLKANDADYLLGLFEPSHMKYYSRADMKTEPTLAEMTETAINILKREKKGFFLFVEGAKIDMAHHFNLPRASFDETIEFGKAVQRAVDLTSEDDTLIVVTSDHSHTMSISGYPERGSNILTTLEISESDSLPYSPLSYANGPGYKPPYDKTRYNMTSDNFLNYTYPFPSLVPMDTATHGGDDVPVFARGPWAHMLTGIYEQNYIPIAMGYAAKIGPVKEQDSNKSNKIQLSYFVLLFTLFVFISNTLD